MAVVKGQMVSYRESFALGAGPAVRQLRALKAVMPFLRASRIGVVALSGSRQFDLWSKGVPPILVRQGTRAVRFASQVA
jgi:hypothetical protein